MLVSCGGCTSCVSLLVFRVGVMCWCSVYLCWCSVLVLCVLVVCVGFPCWCYVLVFCAGFVFVQRDGVMC